jgi:hypothetical protein
MDEDGRIRLFGKKIPITVTTAILLVGLVSAGLVTYLSNTIRTEFSVESPLVLQDDEFGFDLNFTGDSGLALLQVDNHANISLEGTVKFIIEYSDDGNDWGIYDGQGLYFGVSPDLSYCESHQGNMTGVSDCNEDFRTWINNNPSFLNWGLSHSTENYDECQISTRCSDGVLGSWNGVDDNDGDRDNRYCNPSSPETSCNLAFSNGTYSLPGIDFPATDTTYLALWVATDIGLTPGYYRITSMIQR